MLFSRDWLGGYVELTEPAEELAALLTAIGHAVERVEERRGDALFDVDITTNRPDCMNHLGLARELAVRLDRPLRPPRADGLRETAEAAGEAAAVEVEDEAGCPRYLARVVRGVRVGESPAWLRERLEAIGQRPINNLVDVTNFVLWELGQPLHAFDLARLAGGRIVVRRARAGERLVTLDGVERRLDPSVLVIADAERAVALAGIMGGADSEVTGATRDLLIESAHFDRGLVRQAAKALGMHTDASHRFERGSDPEACRLAADRAAALIAELAGGEVAAGAIDVRSASGPAPRRGRLELARLDAFAGAAIPPADARRWLTGLGFGVAAEDGDEGAWRVSVPSWRLFDFEPRPEPPHEIYPADLYEEVLRFYGYDRVAATLPALPGRDAGSNQGHRRRAAIADYLAAAGYVEAIDFGFHDPAADAELPGLVPEAVPLHLANPLSERWAVMRRSLLPGLLASARFNLRRGAAAVALFEIGHVFAAGSDGTVEESERVALLAGGTVGTPWDRHSCPLELDLFDLKGAVEGLAESLGTRLEARPASRRGLVEGTAADLLAAGGGPPVGYLGRLDSPGDPYPLYVAELSTEALGGGARSLEVEVPSRFPGVGADLTLTHPREVAWAEIERAITAHALPDQAAFGLRDRYAGEGVPAGAVNTTIYFLYGSTERSLTQEEVNLRQAALAAELTRRFGWRGQG